ncbi:TIGR01906 family membrane protein, partial [Listeria monocytogenes]|nr:TIGR01906 family membrane protein [Listeria monocytogenes]
WMFDYRTDPIISFLPETFFFLCFLLIVTISVSTLTTIHHLFNKEERTL